MYGIILSVVDSQDAKGNKISGYWDEKYPCREIHGNQSGCGEGQYSGVDGQVSAVTG